MKPVLRGAIFCLWLLPPFEVPVLAAEFSAPLKVLHHFSANNQSGYNGQGGLIKGSDGALYGTTSTGGRHDLGTIFSSDCNGGKYRLLHAFGDSLGDGWKPFAGLIEGSDGKLYGTTLAGGTSSQGAVFSVGKDGKGYQVLRSFPVPVGGGQNLYSPVVEGSDGALYGSALSGGAEHTGLIFRMSKDGRDYSPIWTFTLNGPEGNHPYGSVLLDTNGAIYGVTTSGGAERQGAVFRLDRASR
ncbi:MAG TPA: choice-of-anchor tandem repeat GloVer-containing protein [Haliangiales bacterium]|nr:choice-of-anchor tandem repeat GloVer-containing protein [Haliangiales bacterium]